MARTPAAPATPREIEEEILTDPPTEIDPYKVLGVVKSASADEIKSAYRKAALRHHPDKAGPEQQERAKRKFQEIAFAYAVLSDEKRRRRYDTTGNTAESLNVEDDDFEWVDFFREQTAAMVDGDMIETIKREYQGSEEEREDVVRVYVESEGNMDAVYEEIMCSNVLDDDKRFRSYIDQAIELKEVENYPSYAKETKRKRHERMTNARNEEQEAMQLAEELGVKDKLFSKKKKKSKNSIGDEQALQDLILSRQKDRASNFLDNLEAKYGAKKGKRPVNEPSEAMFAKNAKKSKAAE